MEAGKTETFSLRFDAPVDAGVLVAAVRTRRARASSTDST